MWLYKRYISIASDDVLELNRQIPKRVCYLFQMSSNMCIYLCFFYHMFSPDLNMTLNIGVLIDDKNNNR